MPDSIQKTSWVDDVEDLGEHFRILTFLNLTTAQMTSKGEDYTDENGIRTIEYTVNEDGKQG